MSLKMCDTLTCCSKTVLFSTKLNQFVPNFNRVYPRHRATLPHLDIHVYSHDVGDFEIKSV